MVTFPRACHQARVIWRVSPAFSSGFSNRPIILPFSELMEQGPRHHLVVNCLQSTFAVEQLSIHFSVFYGEKLTLRRAVITVPVSDIFC